MNGEAPVEMEWEVNGLHITGLSWGEPGDLPVLALHGWLDNAASFACLAPLLTGCHVIALDLTGHGQSDRRSADSGYQIWEDLPEILGVLEALGWDRCCLIGHSRGAIISTLLASAFPERVGKLVLLDAVVPEAVPEDAFVRQLRNHLQDKPGLLARENRVFKSQEEAITSREQAGLERAAAGLIALRNLRPVDEGFTWTTDPRLRGPSAVKMTPAQITTVLSSLEMPTLLMMAENGMRRQRDALSLAKGAAPNLVQEWVAGGHHFHMEAATTAVAGQVNQFFKHSGDPG